MRRRQGQKIGLGGRKTLTYKHIHIHTHKYVLLLFLRLLSLPLAWLAGWLTATDALLVLVHRPKE